MERYETLCLFLLGGSAYVGVELAWRGASHWTMFLAGGACLCYLGWLAARPTLPLLWAAALGALGVSALELAVGLACTRLFRLQVWDYSHEWGNLGGLVCPKYTLFWFVLCGWVLWIMRVLCHTVPRR